MARSLELAERAEAAGATSIWASEHHLFEDGYLPQPLVFLAAVAARTKRARLGTAVMLAPLHGAPRLAEQAAIVDLISGGRLELGLGTGYRLPEFELFGAEMKQRTKETEDCVGELRRLWAEGRVTPAPVQSPPPIWLGYRNPRAARRAGRLGVGLLSLRPESYAGYVEGLAEAGLPADAGRTGGAVHGVLTRDPERAWARLRGHVSHQWDSYAAYAAEGTGEPAPPPIDPDSWRCDPGGDEMPRFMVETPEGAAAILNRCLAGRPVSEIFFWASIAGMPDDLVDEHVELVCTELQPRLDQVRWLS